MEPLNSSNGLNYTVRTWGHTLVMNHLAPQRMRDTVSYFHSLMAGYAYMRL